MSKISDEKWTEVLSQLTDRLSPIDLDLSALMFEVEDENGERTWCYANDPKLREELEKKENVILKTDRGEQYVVTYRPHGIEVMLPWVYDIVKSLSYRLEKMTIMDQNGDTLDPLQDQMDLDREEVIVLHDDLPATMLRMENGILTRDTPGSRLEQLDQNLTDVNKGFFIGSSAFRTMRRAFRDLKNNFPNMKLNEMEDDLNQAKEKLDAAKKAALAYLKTKGINDPNELPTIYGKNQRERNRINAALEVYRFTVRYDDVITAIDPEIGTKTKLEAKSDEKGGAYFDFDDAEGRGNEYEGNESREQYPGQNKAYALAEKMAGYWRRGVYDEQMLIVGLVNGENKEKTQFETRDDVRRFLLDTALSPVIRNIQEKFCDPYFEIFTLEQVAANEFRDLSF